MTGISRALAQKLNPLIGADAHTTMEQVSRALKGLALTDQTHDHLTIGIADVAAAALDYEVNGGGV